MFLKLSCNILLHGVLKFFLINNTMIISIHVCIHVQCGSRKIPITFYRTHAHAESVLSWHRKEQHGRLAFKERKKRHLISQTKTTKKKRKKKKKKTLSQILSLHHCQLLRSTIINLPTWNQMPYHTKSLVGSPCPTPLYPATCLPLLSTRPILFDL